MKAQSPPHELRQPLHGLKRYFGRYGIFAGAGVILALVTLLPTYARNAEKQPGANAPIPVTATTVKKQSMPVWIDAQGTVIPRNYVNVMPRVAGLLESIDFKEGQSVKAGQLLATIDARPYRIQLDQAKAQLSKDQAQLDGAQSDLARYETLLKQESIAEQQVSDQRALVAQLIATVAVDKTAVDNASLQLDWTRITAPSSGIVGLRQVDVGNMVGTGGAIGGLFRNLPGLPRVQPARLKVSKDGRFGLIGSEHIDQLKQLVGKRSGRCRVQNDASAGTTGGTRRGNHSWQRILELKQNERRAVDGSLGGLDILGREAIVGAGHDNNRVVAVVRYENEGDAAHTVWNRQQGAHVASHLLEVGPHASAKIIRADASEHGDIPSQTRRGVGLVGALAAGLVEVSVAGHRLAHHRDARRAGYQIHIQTANHYDLARHEICPRFVIGTTGKNSRAQ